MLETCSAGSIGGSGGKGAPSAYSVRSIVRDLPAVRFDLLGGASPGVQGGVSRLLFSSSHTRLALLPRGSRKVTRLDIRAAEVKRPAGEPPEETLQQPREAP